MTGKRVLDLICSLFGIVFFMPLWVFLALLVKSAGYGPVFFLQTRIGLEQKPFTIIKFRTVPVEGASAGSERLGAWLRRWKLDEVPQLINILTGEMSFVGPRPYIPEESKGLDPERFVMRPGLTGLAQVNGNTCLSWEERTAYDIRYVHEYSLLLDLIILLRTIRLIVRGENFCVHHYIESEK